MLELTGVSKAFGAVQALKGVDFAVASGEIVGLIGANGAGKSTLIRVIAGATTPDSGRITLDGAELSFSSPREALRVGIALVPQETNLTLGQSVADNVFLGRPTSRGGFMLDRRLRAQAQELLGLVGLGREVRPSTAVSTLTSVQQKLVSIAQALSVHPRILILDEPTAALPTDTARQLQPVVRALAERGGAVIYISHRLQEVQDLCDRVVAMRDGALAGVLPREQVDFQRMVHLVGGRALEGEPHQRTKDEALDRKVVLGLRGASGVRVRNVDLGVHAGEILGVGGLHGSGRSELLRLLGGVQRLSAGELEVAGGGIVSSPHEAARRGLGYLPEGRARMILPSLSVQKNLTVTVLRRLQRLGVVSTKQERSLAKDAFDQMGVVGALHNPIRSLSGGNQQKVCLGRWVLAGSTILLLDEPTVGVDVHARAEIHRLLRAMAEQGTTIVVACAEPEELVLLCDRVVILVEGRLERELIAPFDSDAVVSASYARQPDALSIG